jgi:L-seryl-tRNA(Ser) seleniumtransferase
VLLILDTHARGREVVVSRSELIEIGGAFRLPDVLERSGAVLVEVGTTNKTYVGDYERALNDRTGLLLKSHPSNFRIIGFTHEVTPAELAELGRQRGVLSVMDLGSGVLLDLARWGLPAEPTVQACVQSGLDLVCFSGDKLLGGPQAGIIVGRKEMVRRCSTNPLMRALRCDRLTLTALAATLAVYRYPERLPQEIPVLDMLTKSVDELEPMARRLATVLGEKLGERAEVECMPGASVTGGGALPGHHLPTWLVRLDPRRGNVVEWAERLRKNDPPVIVRTEDDRLLVDVRTLRPGDEERLVSGLGTVAEAVG